MLERTKVAWLGGITANAPETERNFTQIDAVPWWSVVFRKATGTRGTVETGRGQPPGGGVAPLIPFARSGAGPCIAQHERSAPLTVSRRLEQRERPELEEPKERAQPMATVLTRGPFPVPVIIFPLIIRRLCLRTVCRHELRHRWATPGIGDGTTLVGRLRTAGFSYGQAIAVLIR
jgi:hypothetical protein